MDEVETVDDDVVSDVITSDAEEETLPTRTYKVSNGHIVGMTDDYDAMVQAVDKIMRTERFVFPIYDEQYGNDFNELLGKGFDYATVEVERMLTEALEADDRVSDVSIDSIERTDSTTLTVSGIVETIYGEIRIESEVNAGES